MELDAVENNYTRDVLQIAIDELVELGVPENWAADLVMMVYLIGLREDE